MHPVLRGLCVYFFLWLVFRVAGKRTLAEATSFDLVLLLLISETTQQAMVEHDHSLTSAALLIFTLVSADIVLSFLKSKVPALEPVIDGTAVILVRDGQLFHERMQDERVDADDILEAARELQGVEEIDQIKLAVLERDGRISIVPARPG